MSREEARKEKMGAGDLRMGTGGGSIGNCSSSGSGLILIPQPFPPPPKPQPLCERKLGFVVPVLPGDKEWE